jgi:hypothetical protein
VDIRGDTEETFRLLANHAVTARIIFEGEAASLASRWTRATLKRLDWNGRDRRNSEGTDLSAEAAIDGGGKVCFSGRFRGEYALTLRHQDAQRFVLLPLPNSIHVDTCAADQDLGDVVFPSGQLSALTCELSVESGSAPPPSYVTAVLRREGSRPAMTLAGLALDAEHQVIQPLLAGVYDVALAAPGYKCNPPTHRVKIAAGAIADPIRFTLAPQGVVRGSVQPAFGPWRRVALKEVTIVGSSGTRILRPGGKPGAADPYEELITHKDLLSGNAFTFVDLPPGEYEVTARADGFKAAAARVTVEAGRMPYLLLYLHN